MDKTRFVTDFKVMKNPLIEYVEDFRKQNAKFIYFVGNHVSGSAAWPIMQHGSYIILLHLETFARTWLIIVL